MTEDRLLLAKYSDWTVIMMEILNTKNRFGFSLDSTRNLYKLLQREGVRLVSMNSRTWIKIRCRINDTQYFGGGIVEDPDYFYADFFGRKCLFHNEMEDDEIFMVNRKNEAILMKITLNWLDFSEKRDIV